MPKFNLKINETKIIIGKARFCAFRLSWNIMVPQLTRTSSSTCPARDIFFRTTYPHRSRIVASWSETSFIMDRNCIHSQLYLSIICTYNSIIDLFRKGYQGIKSDFWQLIPRWSSGLVVWLMTNSLGFDSPHNLILKNNKF